MKITAPLGRDNVEQLRIKYNNLAFDFATFGVTRVQVIAGSASISSDNSDVSYTGDTLSVKFGKLDLVPGYYNAQIVLYTPTHPAGVVIAGPDMPETVDLTLIVSEVIS